MAERSLDLGELVKCLALDAVEALPILGDLAALAHAVYLLSKDRKEEALLVFGNVNPSPISLGCLLAYLSKGRAPI